MRWGDLVALGGGQAVDQRIGVGEIQCAGDDTGLPQDALDGVGGARAVPQGGVEGVGDVGDQPGTENRVQADDGCGSARCDSFTRTFKPLRVDGSRVTSSKATSPSEIWAPSATNPAVTPLTMRGTRSGLDESSTTGPAARNVRGLFERLNEQACYLRLDECGVTRGDFDSHD